MVGNGIVHGHAKSKGKFRARRELRGKTDLDKSKNNNDSKNREQRQYHHVARLEHSPNLLRTFSVPTHGTFNTLRIRTKKEGIHRILKYEVSAPVSTILTHSVDNNDIDDNDDEEKNNDENLRCRKGFNESLPVDSDPCSGSEALTHAWPEKNLVQSGRISFSSFPRRVSGDPRRVEKTRIFDCTDKAQIHSLVT